MSFENINWSNFYQAYTGLQFSLSDGCKLFLPNYKHISKSLLPSLSGSELNFSDEFTNKTFLSTNSTDKINSVLLRELYEYAENNIVWDDFNEILSFNDIEVQKIELQDFLANIDEFLVYNQLSKFGNVWWSTRVVTDFNETDNWNVFGQHYKENIQGGDFNNDNIITQEDVDIFYNYINNPNRYYDKQYDILKTGTPSNTDYVYLLNNLNNTVKKIESFKFWSPDKFINDELKKYISNPGAYSGPLTSGDFTSHGWFTIPDLKISSKPFEKLKIAQILLNINFTFDPSYFGNYYTLDSSLSGRIKDLTSNTVYDQNTLGNSQNSGVYSDTLITNWIGGLTSTDNLSTLGETGTYASDNCNNKETFTDTEISHAIAGQVSLNINYDTTNKDVIGTIDPINWKSTESESNSHNLGILSVDRSFGGASGDIDGGVVHGGIRTFQNDLLRNEPEILSSIELWDGKTTKFLKNINVLSNTPRCFHIQGGAGNKTGVFLGGYSKFNTQDQQQFSEYGKSGVRDDLEVFIKSDEPIQSYFKTIPYFKLNVPRGDASGAFTVNIKDRQDRFQIKDELTKYNMGKNEEQTIMDFVENKSQTGNAKRYSILNIDGIIYGGSSTGNSYLTTQSTGDILNSFEKIRTVYIDVGQTSDNILNQGNADKECIETIADIVNIQGNDNVGKTVVLKDCGVYKITYIDGYVFYGKNTITTKVTDDKRLTVNDFFNNVFGGGSPKINDVGYNYFYNNWAKGGKGGGNPFKTITNAVTNTVSQIGQGIANTTNDALKRIGLGGLPDISNVNKALLFGLFPVGLLVPGLLEIGIAGILLNKVPIPNIFGSRFTKKGKTSTTIIPKYSAELSLSLNEQKLNSVAFEGSLFTSINDLNNYMQDPFYPNRKEFYFCSYIENSTLKLLFNDTFYDDNTNSINVSVCYVGGTDSCPTCDQVIVDRVVDDLGVTYSQKINEMTYPVEVHGHKYVGNADKGLSTGGRCEISTISIAEQTLLDKYKKSYEISKYFDETYNDLIKARVLDYVYENNGTTWVRKQNLIESVYYHTGVGDETNAIFFGGLHDSISNYKFRYNNQLINADIPDGIQWSCFDEREETTLEEFFYGKSYSKIDISGSTCFPSGNNETWELSVSSNSPLKEYILNPKNYELINATGGIYDIDETSDGSIIFTSYILNINNTNKNYLFKFKNDKRTPDYSFLNNIYEFSDGDFLSPPNPILNTVKVQSDGKILIGGDFTKYNGATRRRLIRLNSDGTEDTSFYSNLGTSFNTPGLIWDIDTLSDGSIIVAGEFSSFNGYTTKNILKLNSNGTLNTSFNDNLTNITGSGISSTITCIEIQSDDKILIGGTFTNINGSTRYKFARLNSNGTEDVSFATNAGEKNTFIINDIKQQPDGKILIGCNGLSSNLTSVSGASLVRYNIDGTVDNTFNRTSFLNGFTSSSIYAIEVDNTNIFVNHYGLSNQSINKYNGIIKFDLNGNIDEDFSDKIRNPYINNINMDSILKKQDGNLLIGGSFTSFGVSDQEKLIEIGYDGSYDISPSDGRFSNPEYDANIPLERDPTYLYMFDSKFPQNKIYDIYPNGNQFLVGIQCSGNNFSTRYPDTTSNIGITAQNISSFNQFGFIAQALSGAKGKFAGFMSFNEVHVNFNNILKVYPENISGFYDTNQNKFVSSIRNEDKVFRIIEVRNTEDGIEMPYVFQQVFEYTDSQWPSYGITSNYPVSGYALNGIGLLTFKDLESIKDDIKNNVFSKAKRNLMCINTTSIDDTSGAAYILGTAEVKFDLYSAIVNKNLNVSLNNDFGFVFPISSSSFSYEKYKGLMIGVKNRNINWTSSLERCGDDRLKNINILTQFSDDIEKWGTPLWSKNLIESNSVTLSGQYKFNTRIETVTGNKGYINNAITSINFNTKNISSILTNRILLNGNSYENKHYYARMNEDIDLSGMIPYISASANCSDTLVNIDSFISSMPVSGSSYTEWASAFIQEYKKSSPFEVPNNFITSNGYKVKLKMSGNSYKGSSWKRYMDNTGFGGDVPNYDSIYDVSKSEIRAENEWFKIKNFYIGQMAFGTPAKCVVVGGHKVDPLVGKTGFGSGLHYGLTSKRTFLWDKSSIAPEDAFNNNYLGRRFNNFYSTYNTSISANKNTSSISCILFNAESDIIVERVGTSLFDGTKSSIDVKLDSELPDSVGSNYQINITPSDNVKIWWSNKSTSGFTLNCELENWKGNVDWSITAIIKVTENDLTSKSSTEGYKFNI